MTYMDILVNGNQREKFWLSYRLFDCENKGFFSKDEFSNMISSMVSIWTALTGTQFSKKFKGLKKRKI